MNKENNRSAAGLRRSAVVERLRLREEWSELKGVDVPPTSRQNVLTKKQMNPRCTPSSSSRKQCQKTVAIHKETTKAPYNDALHGVVALVDVGPESKALPLRAALAALGASVVSAWSPLVTHLIWTDGGCRSTRAKARALGCRLAAPLWVEACAAAGAKLGERAFPTASRQSDLPSPRTLRRLLKRAEMENIPLIDLLSDSKDDDIDGKPKPLRMSTDTEHDTSADTSNDTIDVVSRVNTAPRRALANTSTSPDRPTKSRRKLFTQKEAQMVGESSDEESDKTTKVLPQKRVRIQHSRVNQREKNDLARAERMAKRILASCTTQDTRGSATQTSAQYRIVLTGMSRAERQTVTKAIQELKGRIQNHVTKRTTHVLLGSCRNENPNNTTVTNQCESSKNTCSKNNDISSTSKKILHDMSGVMRRCDSTDNTCYKGNRNLPNISGVTRQFYDLTTENSDTVNIGKDELQRNNGCFSYNNGVDNKARTLNALQGAARGCRVLHARWAIDSANAGKWLHHNGYEVHHLRKICQKARVERNALGRTQSDYAYDVFNGIRIRITANAEQRDAVTLLLKLCGAVVHEAEHGGCTQDGGREQNGGRIQDGGRVQDGGREQNGGRTQDGGRAQNRGRTQDGGVIRDNDCDIIIGVDVGQVSSKWVFDSVAAARMRTTRRYINSSR